MNLHMREGSVPAEPVAAVLAAGCERPDLLGLNGSCAREVVPVLLSLIVGDVLLPAQCVPLDVGVCSLLSGPRGGGDGRRLRQLKRDGRGRARGCHALASNGTTLRASSRARRGHWLEEAVVARWLFLVWEGSAVEGVGVDGGQSLGDCWGGKRLGSILRVVHAVVILLAGAACSHTLPHTT